MMETPQNPAFSRLTLGTVQFGLRYGIANETGQVSRDEVRAILALAHENGMNGLDTAAIYGDSETVLGWAMGELGLRDFFQVVTKVPPIPPEIADSEARVNAFVVESVVTSLKRLGADRLSVCLFHREEDLRFAPALLRLRERGLVGRIGWSVMTVAATNAILRAGVAEAIQLPLSLLDRRFLRAGILSSRHDQGILWFARSIYLQGLLLMGEEKIPDYLTPVIAPRRRLEAIASEGGLSLQELAMRYALSLPGITSLVVGVDSPAQLAQNLATLQRGPLSRDIVNAVHAAVPDLPDAILLPSNWAHRMNAPRPA
jgi:aryl-alcohol dehydrogenase-like predicted oxidoreductase